MSGSTWMIQFEDIPNADEAFTGLDAEAKARERFAIHRQSGLSATLWRSVNPDALTAVSSSQGSLDNCECQTRAALLFVKAWFAELEGRTDEEDPLTAMRRKFHAPVHAAIDAALAAPCPCAGMREELERARCAPMGDNHHNAAKCPHCRDASVEAECDRLRAELAATKTAAKASNLRSRLLGLCDAKLGNEAAEAECDSLRAELAASQERERVLRDAVANLIRVLELMDPPDTGYVYDETEAECMGCSKKAATMTEIEHDEDCIVLALKVVAAALATPEGAK